MRVFKKLNVALALALTLALAVPIVTPVTNVAVAEAATIKLNRTKKTLKVGETCQLKVSGTKKTVKWKSSKKSVASVSSKGRVKAKRAGKTNITATVSGKTLKCKITVKEAENPAVANAPFDAKEIKNTNYSFAAPKDWIEVFFNYENVYTYMSSPNPTSQSSLMVMVTETDEIAPDYEDFKTQFSIISEETLKAELEESGYTDVQISNFYTSDVTTPLGTAFKYSFTAKVNSENGVLHFNKELYTMAIDYYTLIIMGTDMIDENIANPAIMDVAEYALTSFLPAE